MPHSRHKMRLGSRQHPLPLSISQLLIRHALLLAVVWLAAGRTPPELRFAKEDTIRTTVRYFLVCFLPLTALVHIAGSVLHEGPPFGTAVRKRVAACALCWPPGIVAFFWAAVLCGASVTEQGWATLHFAALMSSFVFLPVAATIALDGLRWQYIFAHWHPSGTDELSAVIPAAAAVVASWFGALPTPLDWGTQWQVFPVSSIIAATAGYAVGLVLTVPIALFIRQLRVKQQRQRPATDWDD